MGVDGEDAGMGEIGFEIYGVVFWGGFGLGMDVEIGSVVGLFEDDDMPVGTEIGAEGGRTAVCAKNFERERISANDGEIVCG